MRIDDSPGGLHKASSVLAKNGINVEDAYGFTIRGSHEAVFVFQVKDVKKTEKILQDAGFSGPGGQGALFSVTVPRAFRACTSVSLQRAGALSPCRGFTVLICFRGMSMIPPAVRTRY